MCEIHIEALCGFPGEVSGEILGNSPVETSWKTPGRTVGKSTLIQLIRFDLSEKSHSLITMLL